MLNGASTLGLRDFLMLCNRSSMVTYLHVLYSVNCRSVSQVVQVAALPVTVYNAGDGGRSGVVSPDLRV